MNNLRVTKSNHLIESSYHLSLQEQRLLLACISKIDSNNELINEITLSAEMYGSMFNIPQKRAYSELKNSSKKLYERSIVLKGSEKDCWIRWISKRALYHKGEGKVEMTFSQDVIPYLTELKGRFTSYQIKNISSLRSVYSIRLYELLMQWKKTKTLLVTIDDFKTYLQLESKYPNIKELRRRVITPAIDELNKESDIQIEVEYERKGRKIHQMKFTFKYKIKGDGERQIDFLKEDLEKNKLRIKAMKESLNIGIKVN